MRRDNFARAAVFFAIAILLSTGVLVDQVDTLAKAIGSGGACDCEVNCSMGSCSCSGTGNCSCSCDAEGYPSCTCDGAQIHQA